ncbi:major facilitator superfamily domain-containing protein [Zychaea mexicana]|uniref:major facilitator superfamily domain-containing protein n=1 Tax=Zychaea mexicana TaxID=64656 RepID=UPI0022FE4642|nr:major facilitator superfamily domain-containing protein [Zychaea mexicana]KAI9496315.1 major facilitator superfamily domain-containing protein [Zychaea mexicana]
MAWADKTQQYKKIMAINMLIGLVFILSISLVPSITTSNSNEWTITTLVSIGCLGYAFFGYPIIGTCVDCATLRVLGDRKQQLYGKMKMGCPVGFGLSVFLTGISIDLWGPYALFGIFATCVLSFVCTCLLTDLEPYPWPQQRRPINNSNRTTTAAAGQHHHHDDVIVYGDDDDDGGEVDGDNDNVDDDDDDKLKSPSSIWDLATQPQAVRFFIVMTLLGIVMGNVTAFLFLFIEKDLHGSPALVGLLGPLASCTEVVCFFFAKDIFRWLGPRRMLIVAHSVLVCRCLIYMIATTISSGAYLAAASQPLHGICFSLLWSAGVVEADNIAPPALKARSQGLLGTVYLGLGAGVGSLVCGYVYEHSGAVSMWLLTMILTLVSLFTYTAPVVDKCIQSLCAVIARRRHADYTVIASSEHHHHHNHDPMKDDNE